jgi:hypothetical protein
MLRRKTKTRSRGEHATPENTGGTAVKDHEVGNSVAGAGGAGGCDGPPSAVVGLVLGQDRPQMPLAEDQHPVGDLRPGGEHESFRISVVQQRSSGGCWRTLTGLTEFALVQSYLSTAAKSGISKLDALRDLFNGHAWLPPGLEPA